MLMKRLLLFLSLISLNLGMAQDFWIEVAPENTIDFTAKQISIVDENVIWLNIDNSDISTPTKWAKSEDGGITWAFGEYSIPNTTIGCLHAISNNVVYATSFLNDYTEPNPTGINGVWKTVDSGATWTQQTSATFSNDSFVNSIHFWDENKGIVLGDPVNNSFEIFTTLNGGANWTQVPSTNIPSPLINEVGYVLNIDTKGNTIWFGTNAGRIFKSNNQGLNWTVSQSPIQTFGGDENSGNFAFKNENEGLLINNQWQQWRTLDGGVSWNQEFPMGNVRIFNTVFIPETNNAYFQYGEDLSGSRGSSLSINGGQEWINLNPLPNSVEPHVVKFKNNNIGFCIGNYTENFFGPKKFFKLNGTNTLLSTENFNINKISISPNPIRDFVKISGNQISTIEIYDVTGKVVILENFIASNEISLNIENLQNGIYIAKVKSETDSVSTIKIIKE